MPVIAISGMPGCGATTTGSLLAKKLGLEFFSVGNYYKKKALEHVNVKEETERVARFWHSKEGGSSEAHNKFDDMQVEIAKKGNVVMDGKLAIHMLKDATLKVWLKATISERAERVAERDKISLHEASKILSEKQQLERKNWKNIYGFDYFDQEKEADLIIDVSEKSPEEITDIIIKKLRQTISIQ